MRDTETLTLQELEQIEIIRPLIKWGRVVHETRRLAEFTAMAFRHAMTGRPGPVCLEIPVDVLNGEVEETEVVKPEGYRPEYAPSGSPAGVARALAMLEEAKRPIIIAGSGAYYAGAEAELRTFSELTYLPVFTNLMGRGLLPDDHPHCAGKVLTAGLATIPDADLVLILGSRLSLYLLFGKPPLFSLNTRLIQVDIEGAEIGRNREVALGIVADVKEVLVQMIEQARTRKWPHRAWCEEAIQKARAAEKTMVQLMMQEKERIHPLRLMKEINDFLDRDAVVVADGGDTQAWTSMARDVFEPGHYLESGVFGCLGVGIPFALAAKLRYPEKQVLVTMGDGSAGLNLMEFHTAVRFNLPIVMVVSNDCGWGMIRHAQEARMAAKGKSVIGCELGEVAYEKLVADLGGYGERVDRVEDLRPALARAFNSGRPACLNVYTDPAAVSPVTMMLGALGIA